MIVDMVLVRVNSDVPQLRVYSVDNIKHVRRAGQRHHPALYLTHRIWHFEVCPAAYAATKYMSITLTYRASIGQQIWARLSFSFEF